VTALPPALAACRYVVVLGGGNGDGPGVSANNLLSASARARLVEGVRLLRVLPEAKLIVSGPADGPRDSHATVLGRTAIALGLPPERIVTIDEARDTEAEAQAVQRRVQAAPIALVTSAWHLPRAQALFRRGGRERAPLPGRFHGPCAGPVSVRGSLLAHQRPGTQHLRGAREVGLPVELAAGENLIDERDRAGREPSAPRGDSSFTSEMFRNRNVHR
jgi:uncharacterized SAM-binding protein YcdF (DUF218 family)